MIERISIQNRRHMTGFTLEYADNIITIGEGSIESSVLPEVQFELMYDSEMPILHDLYIVEVDEGYDYRLLATYLDGHTMAYYDQDGRLFHRLMTIETSPDGTFRGDFVFLEEQVKEEGGHGEDATPYNQETSNGN